MSKLAAIVLAFMVLGASTQCVADCLTQQQSVPACHRHSQSKTPAPEHCNHAQLVAHAQATCPPTAETLTLSEAAFELAAPQAPPPDRVSWSFNVLRL